MASSREELEDIPNQLLRNPDCPEYIKEAILQSRQRAQQARQAKQAEDQEESTTRR
ncbi:MAG: hypothetical protein WC116_09265 [Thermovirgaceae bacterium]|nr:hypothetical protein [Synergistales bacterium]